MTTELTNEHKTALAHRVVQRLRADMADEDEHPAHVAVNSDGTCSDLSCPCQEFARKEVEQPRPQLWADVATVRAAIADVCDSGWNRRPWHFDPDDETRAQTEHRCAFVVAVLARIHELQQLHNYPQLANYCDFHKRRRLPAPTTFTCADCERQAR